MKKITGFTLIELLAVITVILIVMGLGISAYLSSAGRSKTAAAKAMIAAIELALERSRGDNGAYPNYNNDLNSAGAGSNKISQSLDPNYIEFRQRDVDGSGLVIDPWGNAYRVYVDHDGNNTTYSVSGNDFDHNRSSCYIQSAGKNGTFGDGDDINNYHSL